MPDNESSAKIDTAAVLQWIKDLDAAVERMTDPRVKIDRAAITAIRQRIEDLEAAVERIHAALPPPN